MMLRAERTLRALPTIPDPVFPLVMDESAARSMITGISIAAFELDGVGGDASGLIDGNNPTGGSRVDAPAGLSSSIPDVRSAARRSGEALVWNSG